MESLPEGSVFPIFGGGDEVGAEGVSFDVAADFADVLEVGEAALDGEGFEAALVEAAFAGVFVVGVPALGVGLLEPFHEVGDFSAFVFSGPEEEVEVVGHDDVGEESEVEAEDGLFEDGFEGGVIGIGVEDSGAGGGAVHDVVDDVAGEDAGFAGHGVRIAGECGRVNETMFDPFFFLGAWWGRLAGNY